MAERGIIFKDDSLSVPSKSWFDMSYDNLLSMNFGEIVPTTCMECMAEDVIHAKSSNFTRLAPLVAPAFGKVNQFSYHFYVRNRDIWSHWDSFMTNADQKQSWQSSLQSQFIPPVMPYIDVRNVLYRENGFWTTLAGNNNDLILLGFTSPLQGTGTDVTFHGLNADVHTLLFWTDTAGTNFCSRVKGFKIPNNIHQFFAIHYIPNKNEVDGKVFHYPNQAHIPYYNPFSNGSLFDYLGVDLTGMYRSDNYDTFTEVTNFVDTQLSTDVIALMYKSTPSPFEIADGKYIGDSFSYDTENFESNHAIIGCSYVGGSASSNIAISTATMRYFKLVNGTDSTGNVTDTQGTQLRKFLRTEESSKISSLPLRAYQFIYLEYFRDENYIDVNPMIDFVRDGDEFYNANANLDDQFDFLTLQVKAWEHDPYTTALPGPQRGQAVRFLSDADLKFGNLTPVSSSGKYGSIYTFDDPGLSVLATSTKPSNISTTPSVYPVQVDLSAATIENFRFANATQRYLEKVARSGNRYYEYMKSIFGADIEDAKLNRPIFLQGDKSPIQISEVLQTSASQLEDDQPLGQMAGRAVSVGNDDYLEYVTPDNGFFVELCCVIPRVSYQQGLAPMFTRKVQLDYPLPDFAQLGEEQVKQGELYFTADDTEDERPFGYQSRYYQWKYQRDVVHGEFKDSLDHWTWARKFDTPPVAGKKFLEVDVDYRQFAVPLRNQEHVYTHMFHDIQVCRCLPIFGVPSL